MNISLDTNQANQGRLVGAEDLALIRSLIADHPQWHRTKLSREPCRIVVPASACRAGTMFDCPLVSFWGCSEYPACRGIVNYQEKTT